MQADSQVELMATLLVICVTVHNYIIVLKWHWSKKLCQKIALLSLHHKSA